MARCPEDLLHNHPIRINGAKVQNKSSQTRKELLRVAASSNPSFKRIASGDAVTSNVSTPMWQQRKDLDEPEDDTVLWRYFPTNRFLTLIDNEQLYLRRADLFDDQLEGLTPFGTAEEITNELPLDVAMALLMVRNIFRGKMFVSCLHENPNENLGMWKQYAQNSSGVAVKTTAKKIRDCLTCVENIVLGRVRYIDFSSHPCVNDVHEQHLLKDKSYAFEKEVRLLYTAGIAGGLLSEVGQPDPQEGLNLQVDIHQLLGEIVLGANMSEVDEERVQMALNEIKLSIDCIRKSEC